MSRPHNNSNETGEQETEFSMVVFDRFPADAVSASRRQLALAVLWMVLSLGVVAVAVAYTWDGTIPAWLDANGGKWAWLVAGAIAGLFVFDELADAMSTAALALEEYLQVREHAREVLALPPSQRLSFIETTPAGTSVFPPAGLTSVDDLSDDSAGGER